MNKLDDRYKEFGSWGSDDEVDGVRTYYAEAPSLFGGVFKADGGETVKNDREAIHQMRLDELEFVKIAKEQGITLEQLKELYAGGSNENVAEASSQPKSRNSCPTWDEFSESYLDELTETNNVRNATIKEYRASCRRLSMSAGGDKPLNEIDTNLLTAFYRSMSNLSVSTRNKHLSRVGSFLAIAVERGLIPNNPVGGVLRVKDQVRKKDKRKTFSNDDLKRIFESDYFVENHWQSRREYKKRVPYTFWMFPLALFTGARLAELVLIETANVHIDCDVPYLDLQHEVDPDTGDVKKKLKNDNSIRKIPLSDELVKMGFLEFVKGSRGKYLFPDVTEKSTEAGAAQKALSTRLQKLGVWVKETKSFHSFRHTFINVAASAGVDFKYLSAVTGHLSKKEQAEQSLYREMTTTYFKGYDIEVLKREVIDKLQFDVDFSGVRWPTTSRRRVVKK
jgi:integrase